MCLLFLSSTPFWPTDTLFWPFWGATPPLKSVAWVGLGGYTVFCTEERGLQSRYNSRERARGGRRRRWCLLQFKVHCFAMVTDGNTASRL